MPRQWIATDCDTAEKDSYSFHKLPKNEAL